MVTIIKPPKKEREEPKRFNWETPEQYEYRNFIGKVSAKVSNALRSMEQVASSGTLDYSNIKEVIDRCNRNFKHIVPPGMYEEPHNFFIQALQSYAKGMAVLVPAAKEQDTKGMRKAGRLLSEGNSFVQITKSRMWEAIEAKLEDKG